jgi:DNA anti-recombination protein RmuC
MKNDSLFSIFASAIKKASASNDVEHIAQSVKALAEEVTKLTFHVVNLTKLVINHSESIDQLFTVQSTILNKINQQNTELQFPSINKEKSEKPN